MNVPTVAAAPEALIDLDADPFVPEDWELERHHKGGQLTWDACKLELYLSQRQEDRKDVEGSVLREELAAMPLYNANMLDYLLRNPHRIPEEYKDKYVFFWGTIYRRAGRLVVRYLCWRDGQWNWGYYWLGDRWFRSDPAALRAG